MLNTTPLFRRHPLTGGPIEPIGFRESGRAIWPIMGGDDTVEPAAADTSDGNGAKPTADAGAGAADVGDAAKDAGKGGKDSILADLARERDKRQALEKSVADMQQAQKDQMSSLAKAFGLDTGDKPETSAVDALAEKFSALEDQLAQSHRKAAVLEAASTHKIPTDLLHLLEHVPTDKLDEVAKSVGELAGKATAEDGTPQYAPSSGAGNNGGGNGADESSVTAQIAAAEKELQGKAFGTPERRAIERRLMSLKSQQLYAASRQA